MSNKNFSLHCSGYSSMMEAGIMDFLKRIKKKGWMESAIVSMSRKNFSTAIFGFYCGLLIFVPASLFPGESKNENRNQTFGFHFGLVLSAGGSFSESTSSGIDLLDLALNLKILESPYITPIIENVAPFYRSRPATWTSREFSIFFEQGFWPDWYLGVELAMIDIRAGLEVPATFFPLESPGSGRKVYFQFTREMRGTYTLGSDLSFSGRLSYRMRLYSWLSPILTFRAGAGTGWLGKPGAAPWFREVHIGGEIGNRLYVDESNFILVTLNASGYKLKTQSTNPLDRTQVLINPDNALLLMARICGGYGVDF